MDKFDRLKAESLRASVSYHNNSRRRIFLCLRQLRGRKLEAYSQNLPIRNVVLDSIPMPARGSADGDSPTEVLCFVAKASPYLNTSPSIHRHGNCPLARNASREATPRIPKVGWSELTVSNGGGRVPK
ncbi:hypothetical protein PGT21_003126 [Puccinia graminis f. sp. tritici]|uniref:Uncharacterized protein n=1 Tax=Puccinia graminis f. sp. tritici TaxID=56615 RepID=A0A5B0NXF2_PUCGR|nr:hypothetical protein PGT21_003126 [Puccinia graminis f. sp. tritici]